VPRETEPLPRKPKWSFLDTERRPREAEHEFLAAETLIISYLRCFQATTAWDAQPKLTISLTQRRLAVSVPHTTVSAH
jgi:hypothetical protein